MSASTNKPNFLYYLWLDEAGRFDARPQSFRPGELICFQIERLRGRDGQSLQFDTGYTLVEVLTEGTEKVAVVRDAAGATRRMKAMGTTPPFGPLPGRSGPAGAAAPEVQAAKVSQAARCSNILRAPKDSRLLNLGFRCVKDL